MGAYRIDDDRNPCHVVDDNGRNHHLAAERFRLQGRGVGIIDPDIGRPMRRHAALEMRPLELIEGTDLPAA